MDKVLASIEGDSVAAVLLVDKVLASIEGDSVEADSLVDEVLARYLRMHAFFSGTLLHDAALRKTLYCKRCALIK